MEHRQRTDPQVLEQQQRALNWLTRVPLSRHGALRHRGKHCAIISAIHQIKWVEHAARDAQDKDPADSDDGHDLRGAFGNFADFLPELRRPPIGITRSDTHPQLRM